MQCPRVNLWNIVLKSYSIFFSDLAGKTDLDQARADMLIDCYEDTVKPGLAFYSDKDEESKVNIYYIEYLYLKV